MGSIRNLERWFIATLGYEQASQIKQAYMLKGRTAQSCPAFESVDKVATLLAEMPLAENTKDFRTALYSRQYHPRALENR